MQVLVLYYSKGGNTRKIAEAVTRGVESTGTKAVLKSTGEVTKQDFADSAGVIAGSPVYFGIMAADLKRVFDDFVSVRRQMENKVGAAFASGKFPTGGKETTILSILHCMLIYGMMVVGDPLTGATGHYGVGCVNAPDEETADHAFKLGVRIAELCKKMGS